MGAAMSATTQSIPTHGFLLLFGMMATSCAHLQFADLQSYPVLTSGEIERAGLRPVLLLAVETAGAESCDFACTGRVIGQTFTAERCALDCEPEKRRLRIARARRGLLEAEIPVSEHVLDGKRSFVASFTKLNACEGECPGRSQ
jgi:hypothetical protein